MLGIFEILIILIIGLMLLGAPAAVLVALLVANRQKSSTHRQSHGVSRPVLGLGAALLAAIVLLLVFAMAIAGLWFIGQGDPAWVVLLIGGGVCVAAVAAMVGGLALLAFPRHRTTTNGAIQRRPTASEAPVDHDLRQTIIARLTQRFCPQCRTPLAGDAPEGLCPACLLAGGLPSGSADEPVNGFAATTPPSGSQPPATGQWHDLQQHFPELEILELLGQGGMGSVYKVRQKSLDRLAALKVIPPDAAKDPAFAERFGREARALARLNHSNIVTVYDFGQKGDVFYLLMEYVDGVNLRHAMRASRLAPQEALAIVPQICDALQYAHDQGVVHRDIKPENVLLDRGGRVKIADFGLAKLLGKGPDDFTLTRTQQVMGTPRYMAPEQIERPSAVDHRADIYSLGVMFYEMLTGELPMGRFALPSEKVPVDVRIDQVVLRALEREPERRYQRASQVKTELASAGSLPPAPAHVAAVMPASPDSRPAWQTPSPATKSEAHAAAAGEVPLPQVLGVAIGMVMGVLLIGGGLAALVYAMTFGFQGLRGAFWGWIGAGFGCLVGGFGSFAGSYNTYRQMAGAEDLMQSRRTTWFDWVMHGYLALGVLVMLPGLHGLFFDPNEEHVYPMLLLGGIAVFQASLFVMWRMLMRAASSGQTTPIGHDQAGEPSYARAVLVPMAILLGVWVLVGVDLYYSTPTTSGYHAAVSQRIAFHQGWQQAVVLCGLIVIPIGLFVLTAWRAWGPRVMTANGSWRVPFPFAAPAWPIAVAVLAALTLLMPWFRLDVVPGAAAGLRLDDAFSADGSRPAMEQFLTVSTEHLKAISAIPEGGRYAHRGIQQPVAAAVALLLIAGAVLTLVAASAGRAARGLLLLAFGAVALLLCVKLLHDAGESRPAMVVDSITEQGLVRWGIDQRGSRPVTVQPWGAVVSDSFLARPAIGMYAALAASVLAIFLGATELCWGAAETGHSSPRPAPTAPAQVAVVQPIGAKAIEDPSRAAIRRRVSGPAIGLMVAGVIGLLPILLAVLAIPAVTIVPDGSRSSDIQHSPPATSPPSAAPPSDARPSVAPPIASPPVDSSSHRPQAPLVRTVSYLAEPEGLPPGRVSRQEFDRLMQGLKSEMFDNGKLSFIRAWCLNRWFTCEQVREMLATFDFDSDRREAAIVLYPRVTDPQNFFTVLDVFTFDSDRTAVRDAIAGGRELRSGTAAPFILAGAWIVPVLLGFVMSVTMIVGGWQMRQLKSYGLAMTAAVMAMLPCFVGWLIGLPMGIWALTVLNDPKVREAFES